MTHLPAVVPADPDGLARAAAVLAAGGVVAFPTDTVYGLAADPRQEAAVARIFELKGRREGVALPLVAGSAAQAQAAGRFDARALALAAAFWPGPLSIVVPAASVLARAVVAADGTVAVRVPAHEAARGLAAALGFAVTATSANRSGNPPAQTAAEAADGLPGVDLVLDGGPSPGGPPSTIVAPGDRGPVLIRAGAIPWERVLKSAG